MKRYGNLWDKIIDIENIKFAHQQARRGKTYYTEVKMVDADLDKYAKEIQEMLINKTFTTSEYEIEDRHDGRKVRTIYKLPYYPDRIVQHALLNIIGPLLTNCFIRDSFQSIIGRGTHDAAKRVKKLVRSENCPQYALKVDIKKYYPSVNNELMKQEVRRKIKDKDVLWLVDDIINSMQGLPIGNYTSQHFGNLYLNQFDWWIKQEVKPKGYFRYCDDIVVFGDSSKELIKIKNKIINKLLVINLYIKNNWNIYNVHKNGVDFVGYVFSPHKTKLRPTIVKKFKLKCVKLKNILTKENCLEYLSSLMSYKGWVKRCNAKVLWRRHVTYFAKFYPKQIKGAI
jgi:retron-type reverse transcriptase